MLAVVAMFSVARVSCLRLSAFRAFASRLTRRPYSSTPLTLHGSTAQGSQAVRYHISNETFLPCTTVTSTPAIHHVWPYEIEYDNVNMARPPLFINSAVPAKPSSASTTATGVAAREEALRSRPAAVRAREFVRDYPLDELSKRALRVIYSDTDLVVIDKPSGILSVPGIYSRFSAATAVAHVFGFDDGDERKTDGQRYLKIDQSIVHRLDESTSGVLVFARNPTAQKALYAQFRERGTRKVYTAVVRGRLNCINEQYLTPHNKNTQSPSIPPPLIYSGLEGEIDLPLSRSGVNPWQSVNVGSGGKPSLTTWRVLASYPLVENDDPHRRLYPASGNPVTTAENNHVLASESIAVGGGGGGGDDGGGENGSEWRTRVELVPVTGRSHQLRVHLAALGSPIVGDDLYGHEEDVARWENTEEQKEEMTFDSTVASQRAEGTPARHSASSSLKTNDRGGPWVAGGVDLPQDAPRLLLHATSISFLHPTTNAPMKFVAECPF